MKPYAFHLVDRTGPISLRDYRDRALRRLPKLASAYIDGGADDLVSLHQNERAFARWRLRQRALAGVASPDLRTGMAGTELSMPVGLAPTGLSGLTRWNADIVAAKAAERAGVRFVLSSGASHALEEVAEATDEAHWFQLYANGGREAVGWLIDRAQQAGYTALFLTVDTPIGGNRESERRRGVGIPVQLTPGRLLDLLAHPAWFYRFLRHRRLAPVNYDPDFLRTRRSGSLQSIARAVETQFRNMRAELNWDDARWIRDRWRGPLYIKGILDADDAARAVDELGAQGVVVSNHGGRQLDTVPGTLDALPPIVERLGGRGEVYLDGGIRRGTDIIKALCLGAKGVFIGRPYLYGIAVGGQQGAEDVLRILREELARALALMGCPSVATLDRSWLIDTLSPSDRSAGDLT